MSRASLAPGYYAHVSAADYHADPCPAPSLSASIARLLVLQSPLHAWHAHPRLNPAYRHEESEQFDLGTAAHAYLLEGSDAFTVVEAPDWRTKDAREQRDAARKKSKVPILASRWADVQAMAQAARVQLAAHERPIPLLDGAPERTLIWQEPDGLWCRARLDWLHAGGIAIDDYKTTSRNANPDVWSRVLFARGYDIQAAFYLRGFRAVFPEAKPPIFRFVIQENVAPYALSVLALAPDAMILGEKRVAFALERWGACLAADRWPGYPARTCWAEVPGCEDARWLEKEAQDEGEDSVEAL